MIEGVNKFGWKLKYLLGRDDWFLLEFYLCILFILLVFLLNMYVCKVRNDVIEYGFKEFMLCIGYCVVGWKVEWCVYYVVLCFKYFSDYLIMYGVWYRDRFDISFLMDNNIGKSYYRGLGE